jgi:hypothetical protein
MAGALIGLAYLTRPNLVVLLPFAAGALWRMGARGAIAPMMGGAALVIVPWIVRGWLVMGQPFFSLYTVANLAWEMPSFPGAIATYGTLTPRGLGLMIAEHPGELLAKAGGNLLYYARQALFTANPVAVTAFVVGMLRWRRSGPVERALGEWMATTALATVVLAAPVIVVLGVGWILAAVRDRPSLAALATVVLLALPAAGTARDVLQVRAGDAASRWRDPNLETLRRLTQESDVIVTDIGRGVTWYAGRGTIQAPIDRITLERVATIVPVTAIYLSGQAASRWSAMYGASLDVAAYVPAGFVPVASFPDGGQLWRRP